MRRRLKDFFQRLAGVMGPDEIVLAVGLTLITVALWPLVGRVALVFPGAALTWIALPQRAPFVRRPTAPTEKQATHAKLMVPAREPSIHAV